MGDFKTLSEAWNDYRTFGDDGIPDDDIGLIQTSFYAGAMALLILITNGQHAAAGQLAGEIEAYIQARQQILDRE